MATYHVDVSRAPKPHRVHPLLVTFGAWLREQPHGSIGSFDALETAPIPPEWRPEHAERLAQHGYAFLTLPDGSLLALLRPKAEGPEAVVLLGSEGELRTVAPSLEKLLELLATGATGVGDLDESPAAGRKALKAWLAAKKVKSKKAPAFDFEEWLSGAPPAAAPPAKRKKQKAAAEDAWSSVEGLRAAVAAGDIPPLDPAKDSHAKTLLALDHQERVDVLTLRVGPGGVLTKEPMQWSSVAWKLMMEKKRFADALAIFDALVEVDHDEHNCFSLALWAVQSSNNHLGVDRVRARRYLERCLPHGRKLPDIYFNALGVHVELGDAEGAAARVNDAVACRYAKLGDMKKEISTEAHYAPFRPRLLPLFG